MKLVDTSKKNMVLNAMHEAGYHIEVNDSRGSGGSNIHLLYKSNHQKVKGISITIKKRHLLYRHFLAADEGSKLEQALIDLCKLIPKNMKQVIIEETTYVKPVAQSNDQRIKLLSSLNLEIQVRKSIDTFELVLVDTEHKPVFNHECFTYAFCENFPTVINDSNSIKISNALDRLLDSFHSKTNYQYLEDADYDSKSIYKNRAKQARKHQLQEELA